jgi:Flp pilus assembly protein TadG
MHRQRRTGWRDSGSVTAETAVVLPALVLVFALLVSGTRAVAAQLACQDAARIGARAAARGEPVSEVTRLARAVAPRGATVGVEQGGGLVRVRVAALVHPFGPATALPDVVVVGRAVAADESAGGVP